MISLITQLPIPTISSTISSILPSGGPPPKCQVIKTVQKTIEKQLHNYYVTKNSACYYTTWD